MLAGIVFLGVVSLAAAAIVVTRADDDEAAESDEASEANEDDAAPTKASKSAKAEPEGTSEPTPKETAADDGPEETDPDPDATKPEPIPAKSPDQSVWTTDVPTTLEELARTWTIPIDMLAKLNPKLGRQKTLKVGTKVVVHVLKQGGGYSIGPPNDGRLTWGVPLPEGKGWLLPPDRTRAFATEATIASLTAALEAYTEQFPDAEPIQVGELSRRHGGEISGHQSHQSGRDVDIRLIKDADGDGFNPERQWFLVKTLIDRGDITAIFLNHREQPWLRAAAEADVGEASASEYFGLISHEPGHTIHMHVRFNCPKGHKRCVSYPLPGTEQVEPSQRPSKLPTLPTLPDKKTPPDKSKIPGLHPKGGSDAPDKKPRDKKKGKKKDGKKKKGKKKGI